MQCKHGIPAGWQQEAGPKCCKGPYELRTHRWHRARRLSARCAKRDGCGRAIDATASLRTDRLSGGLAQAHLATHYRHDGLEKTCHTGCRKKDLSAGRSTGHARVVRRSGVSSLLPASRLRTMCIFLKHARARRHSRNHYSKHFR